MRWRYAHDVVAGVLEGEVEAVRLVKERHGLIYVVEAIYVLPVQSGDG